MEVKVSLSTQDVEQAIRDYIKAKIKKKLLPPVAYTTDIKPNFVFSASYALDRVDVIYEVDESTPSTVDPY